MDELEKRATAACEEMGIDPAEILDPYVPVTNSDIVACAIYNHATALRAEIERLRAALGKMCEASNYDDPAVRNDLSSALDDVHKIAVNAYYHKGDSHDA